MLIYKAAKFAPVWTTILKIRAIFVHQTLTEHTLCEIKICPKTWAYFTLELGWLKTNAGANIVHKTVS